MVRSALKYIYIALLLKIVKLATLMIFVLFVASAASRISRSHLRAIPIRTE